MAALGPRIRSRAPGAPGRSWAISVNLRQSFRSWRRSRSSRQRRIRPNKMGTMRRRPWRGEAVRIRGFGPVSRCRLRRPLHHLVSLHGRVRPRHPLTSRLGRVRPRHHLASPPRRALPHRRRPNNRDVENRRRPNFGESAPRARQQSVARDHRRARADHPVERCRARCRENRAGLSRLSHRPVAGPHRRRCRPQRRVRPLENSGI